MTENVYPNVFVDSLDDYQAEARKTAAALPDGHDARILSVLGLVGEAGEAAEIVKKWYGQGHELDTEALKKELGDILWYLAAAASANGWSLSVIASWNIAKLRARYPEGFSTTESQKRCECGHHEDDHENVAADDFDWPCTQCECDRYIQFVRVA